MNLNRPDIVALEQAVWILGLVRLLALDGPEPPGVIDHRPKPVACPHNKIKLQTIKRVYSAVARPGGAYRCSTASSWCCQTAAATPGSR